MTARPDLQDLLVSSADIASMIGVSRGAVSNYKKRHPNFPDPAFTDSTGNVRLYWTEDVEAWIAEHFGERGADLEDAAAKLERRAVQMREQAARLRSVGAK